MRFIYLRVWIAIRPTDTTVALIPTPVARISTLKSEDNNCDALAILCFAFSVKNIEMLSNLSHI